VAEGGEATIDQLETALRAGPPGSVVERVSSVRMPSTGGFDGFSVRSSGHGGD
jgi:hypothetical protein